MATPNQNLHLLRIASLSYYKKGGKASLRRTSDFDMIEQKWYHRLRAIHISTKRFREADTVPPRILNA
jgi:hypothetical protein